MKLVNTQYQLRERDSVYKDQMMQASALPEVHTQNNLSGPNKHREWLAASFARCLRKRNTWISCPSPQICGGGGGFSDHVQKAFQDAFNFFFFRYWCSRSDVAKGDAQPLI